MGGVLKRGWLNIKALSQKAQDFLKENRGKKIVFTNGCFDLLHCGHITYLNEAKSLGDRLFVGLNSDFSVKKLKGPHRPIQGERERQLILASLRAVDCVEIFSEETPRELIQCIRPDILVKGGIGRSVTLWGPSSSMGGGEWSP